MFKVIVTKDGKSAFGATFEEIEQANSWIRNQIRKNSWGLPEREVTYHEHQGRHPKAEELETYSDGRVKCKIPADYKVLIQEVEGADPAEVVWERLRVERNKLLGSTDKTMLPDFPLTSNEKKVYREYRQYLRDVPLSYDNVTIYKYGIMAFKEWKLWKHGK